MSDYILQQFFVDSYSAFIVNLWIIWG